MQNRTQEEKFEECDTIFYQGNGDSQTQILKYTGNQVIEASTGEFMWSTGKNKLPPLNVIYKPYIGPEIADINIHPFENFSSYFNPVKLLGAFITSIWGWKNGIKFSPGLFETKMQSVKFHSPILSEVSLAQETDIFSHQKKYTSWKKYDGKRNHLILWGVSRGGATTFNAIAKEKYPEVKLVVLEGAFDSIPNLIFNRASRYFKSNVVASCISCAISAGISFFTKYRNNGPSPITAVENFPEDIPVVFITSQSDAIVPCENTENLAYSLAKRGNNDVYLLKLKNSSHPDYMYDDKQDRETYERFIHAIYKKYGLKHEINLAEKGKTLLISTLISPTSILKVDMAKEQPFLKREP